jgi:hypothetical protein
MLVALLTAFEKPVLVEFNPFLVVIYFPLTVFSLDACWAALLVNLDFVGVLKVDYGVESPLDFDCCVFY